MYIEDLDVQLQGTLPNGELYYATVELTRPIAHMMERITMQDPYKYDRFHWIDLYYAAVELLDNLPA